MARTISTLRRFADRPTTNDFDADVAIAQGLAMSVEHEAINGIRLRASRFASR